MPIPMTAARGKVASVDPHVGERVSDQMPEKGRDELTIETSQQPRLLPSWACLLLGIGLAVIGLLPWLITGLRLPLQNLWATETRPEQMPRVLLPFNQYAVVLIIAVLVIGAAAGLCSRALRPRLARRGVWAMGGGVLLVQLAAVLQTAIVVQGGLSERRASPSTWLGWSRWPFCRPWSESSPWLGSPSPHRPVPSSG